jgi:hypothetical protein
LCGTPENISTPPFFSIADPLEFAIRNPNQMVRARPEATRARPTHARTPAEAIAWQSLKYCFKQSLKYCFKQSLKQYFKLYASGAAVCRVRRPPVTLVGRRDDVDRGGEWEKD